jgi:hypothetical protein
MSLKAVATVAAANFVKSGRMDLPAYGMIAFDIAVVAGQRRCYRR